MPIFTPPTVLRRPTCPTSRLYSRIDIPTGVSVLKQSSGAYVQVESPSSEQLASATAIYLGGRSYEVSAAEAASLTAAGYEVTS